MRLAIVASIFILGCSCECEEAPEISQAAQVTPTSNIEVDITSYTIPESDFRGVLWPSGKTRFEVRFIKRCKSFFAETSDEVISDVPAPPTIVNKELVSEKWTIELERTYADRIIYRAVRNDDVRSLELDLPIKKREYWFEVWKDISGKEILMFMDLGYEENVVDQGLFGYVVISEKDIDEIDRQ